MLNTLLIINAMIFIILGLISRNNANKVTLKMRDEHHFVCINQINNPERELFTTYTYNITTDNDYLVTNSDFIEEIVFSNKKDYESAKDYFLNNSEKRVITNDNKQSID